MAARQTLVEGSMINKSLPALANVIYALTLSLCMPMPSLLPLCSCCCSCSYHCYMPPHSHAGCVMPHAALIAARLTAAVCIRQGLGCRPYSG
jgi:hypothetical protein